MLHKIKLLKYDDWHPVNIKGIGVNGKQLIPFNQKGRCTIDSGRTISYIFGDAHDKLLVILKEYFDRFKVFKPIKYDKEYELCFKKIGQQQGYKDVLGINFYFDNNAKLGYS